jgi:hypothetical protein
MSSLALIRRALLSVVLAWGWVGQADATTYQFSFSNVEGGTAGTVMGLIELPDGDGTFAATALSVTSAPPALGYTLPLNVIAAMPTNYANSFTVSGGLITASSFGRQNLTDSFTLSFGIFGSLLSVAGSSIPEGGVRDGTNSTLVFAAVPEPSALVLGVTGVACVACGAAWRRGSRRG